MNKKENKQRKTQWNKQKSNFTVDSNQIPPKPYQFKLVLKSVKVSLTLDIGILFSSKQVACFCVQTCWKCYQFKENFDFGQKCSCLSPQFMPYMLRHYNCLTIQFHFHGHFQLICWAKKIISTKLWHANLIWQMFHKWRCLCLIFAVINQRHD